jgi:hypothetical protein
MKYCRWINVSENFAVSFFRFNPEEWRCFVFLKCYPPTRLHGVTIQKTVISVLSFLELYIQMAVLTMTARDQIAACSEGESGSPFHYSVSHFTFILLQKHIPECSVSFVLHFHRLFVAKRRWEGMSRSLL